MKLLIGVSKTPYLTIFESMWYLNKDLLNTTLDTTKSRESLPLGYQKQCQNPQFRTSGHDVIITHITVSDLSLKNNE